MEREELYKKMKALIAKILASYIKEQRRSVGPLSHRDEDFISEYRHFLSVVRENETNFYDDMFKNWANQVIDPEFVFDEKIEYIVGRTRVIINLPVIHEWGLNTTKELIAELEVILIVLCATFNESPSVVERCQERLKEIKNENLPVVQKARRNIDLQGLGGMIGPVFNTLLESMGPEMKEQLGPNFDANNVINTLINNPKTKDIITSMQNGDLGNLQDKVKELTQDQELKNLATSLVNDGRPTDFKDLPSELQPPGSPTPPSSPPSSSSSTTIGTTELEGKSKEPMVELE